MKGEFSLEHLLSSTDRLQCYNDMYVCIFVCAVDPEEAPAGEGLPACYVFKGTFCVLFTAFLYCYTLLVEPQKLNEQ